MALDNRYVIAPSLQEYFADKDTGKALSGGKVFYYRDKNRTEPKTVYTLAGNEGNYTYAPLPNPITLSPSGTIVDNNGNDVPVYYFPFVEDNLDESDLYYIVVQNSLGVPQFTRSAWPNSNVGGIPVTEDALLNYVPNGQMLSHTDLEDSTLVGGSNVIAQGGFSIEMSDPLNSTNTIDFVAQGFTQDPPQSPRFIARFESVSFSPLDSQKWFRTKWNDANKFSTRDESFTFSFWAVSNVSIPISVQVYKFFGTNGSLPELITIATDTITTESQTHQFTVNFQSNAGQTIDTVNNDDYVAIDIVFPTTIGFRVDLTNFVLTPGEVIITGFPVQTNADMISRSVFGWVDRPDGDGSDLYLPAILTKKGMEFDRSQVGKIEMMAAPVINPFGDPFFIDPIPHHNMINCDGSTYRFDDVSANGIPFSRLGFYLAVSGSNAGFLWGSGANFASAVQTIPSDMRIAYNLTGTPAPLAADGALPTGFSFDPVVSYAGSTTGRTSLGYFSYTGADPVIHCVKQGPAWINNPTAGTTGFTISIENSFTGITAFNNQFFSLTAVFASSLSNGLGNPAQYWTFSDDSTDYYMWFNIAGETDPAPGGTGIEIFMDIGLPPDEVGDLVREVMNAFNSTNISVATAPPAGSYFIFQTNPGDLRTMYVWYEVDGVGPDPGVPGAEGVKVSITSSATFFQVVGITVNAINLYQFQVPDFRGMFFRGTDPNQTYDTDKDLRWSEATGVSGSIIDIGTFQFDQFRSHLHNMGFNGQNANATGGAGPWVVGGPVTVNNEVIVQNSGGSETRPVNATVAPIIRY